MEWESERRDGFTAVYNQVFPIVLRVTYHIVGDTSVAEELCQEAFVRFYKRMDGFSDSAQAKYWLIRVAKNLALNHAKRRGRERRAYERVLLERPKPPDSGEEQVLKRESTEAVQEALEVLPEKLKTALVLREFGDLSYKEIADVLGISEGNVKVRIFRARERLGEILSEHGGVYVPES